MWNKKNNMLTFDPRVKWCDTAYANNKGTPQTKYVKLLGFLLHENQLVFP